MHQEGLQNKEAKKYIEVLAAIIEDNGKFLLAQRPQGKPYAGKWEFPGGKFEEINDRRETAEECIQREINEELGFDI